MISYFEILFDYNEVRALTAGSTFQCKTIKIKLAKNIKNGFLNKNFFVSCNLCYLSF